MTELPFITRWCRAGVGTLLLLLASVACCAVAASPRRVLILNPFERDIAPFGTAASAFRSTLARELGEPVEIQEVSLDLERMGTAEEVAPLLELLESRLKTRPVDLVVPMGGASVQFAAHQRERLFRDTPVLVVGADPRMVPPDFLRTRATLVAQRVNLPGMVEDILQLRPDTTRIVVVFGASPFEKHWVGECRREFQGFTKRVNITYLDELPFDEVLKQCAALPPHCFILHVFFLMDTAGVLCENNEALRRLHEVANAPLFGYFASEFGLGPIGGRLYQDARVGGQGARAAIRILRGESPESIPPQILGDAAPVYDWRELKRWGINAARLPVGSDIRFRQPGLWERYRWLLVGTASFCLLQMALIAGLFINRAKRRRGEEEASLIADISSKFVNLPASEVDREIEDAQRRICGFLSLDLSALWQWSMQSPRIVTMTHLYRPLGGPPLPEPMYAHEHFPWCQQQLEAGRTVLVSSLESLPAEAARDQEVWRHLGIKSIVTFPLSPGGPVIGALSFNTMRRRRAWPEALLKRLQLVAQIFTNALERKRSDQALRESKERLTLATDAAELGIWAWSVTSNEVWGSEQCLRIFGFGSGEPVNFERIIERIHPHDRATVEREVLLALEQGFDYAGEFRAVLPDGTQHWIASRGRGHLDASGEPARMLGVALDITERKRTDEAFRSSEARLAAGVDLAGLGYYEIDFNENWCFVDDRLHSICGLQPGQQPVLQSVDFWTDHLHPADLHRLLDKRQELQDGRLDRLSAEYRYLHPAAGQKWLQHLVRVANRDAGARVVRTYGVVRDITEQRKAEMEALELRGLLAHADRVTLLGQLASALAHELSQPLGSILRNAEAAEILLQASAPDLEELHAIVKDILSDDTRAGHVIERLRTLLKRRSVALQPIELPGVIDEVLPLVQADAVARHVKLTHFAAADLPRVLGDRVHLQQVLLNLLVNAMDALDKCAPDRRSIQVSARWNDPVIVEVRVSDNGPGIPVESLKRLFEPFFTTKSTGMGMGLPVSKTIIEAHKGRLWAENRPDGGACFCFTLPIASKQ